MSLPSLVFAVTLALVVVSSTASQDASQEIKPLPNIFMQRNGVKRLTEIPKAFEVKKNAQATFDRYISDIETLANAHNYTIRYKVKVIIVKKNGNSKNKMKKSRSGKKYNIPLKKQSMRLSPFERILRKLADAKNSGQKSTEQYAPVTYHKRMEVLTTKIPFSGKYKPVISKIKTNYAKIVKPVKNKVITL